MSIELATRREFLRRGISFVSIGATAPAFLERTAWAMEDPNDSPLTKSKPGIPDDRVLVVLQLAGGNDGLNTIIPYRNDLYYKHRPKLAIRAKDALKIDDQLAFHPAADGLKTLYDAGHLAVVQGVGYPNLNRSHFVGTDIWQTASPAKRFREGWIGRYFDNYCSGADALDSQAGIALVGETPLAMVGEKFAPVTFQSPKSLRVNTVRKDATTQQAIEQLQRTDRPQSDAPLSTLDFVRRTAMDARVNAERIRAADRRELSGVEFPRTALGKSLATVARMIIAEMPTRVYYVSLGGFDTHSGQLQRHRRLLADLGSAMDAFRKALQAHDSFDRCLLMTFSEFGRRVAENGAAGTDHGEAAPMFLLGGKVKAGLVGKHPSLETLHRGDLAFNVDFRRVYASVLKQWLKADADKILGKRFGALPLLNT